MQLEQIATNIDKKVKKRLEDFCRQMGYRMNKFIEDAIVARIEDEMECRALTDAIRNASEFETLQELKKRLKKAGRI